MWYFFYILFLIRAGYKAALSDGNKFCLSIMMVIFIKEVCYNKNLSIFLKNFSELFVIGKYVKIRFKSRDSPRHFLSFRGQKTKNIRKIEQARLFLFTFLVSFFVAFLAQKLIYIWFNVEFSSFFEQDRLVNLIILGIYGKDDLKVSSHQWD